MARRATQVPVKAKRRPGTRTRRSGAMSEAQLSRAVVELATRLGWRVHTLSDSRSLRSHHPGFPDLVLVPGYGCAVWSRLLFVELKVKGRRLTDAQGEWLDLLDQVCAEVDAYVWREKEWRDGTVERILRTGYP